MRWRGGCPAREDAGLGAGELVGADEVAELPRTLLAKLLAGVVLVFLSLCLCL